MAKKTNTSSGKRLIIAIVCVILAGATYLLFFSGMSRTGKEQYIFIDNNDNIDSVYAKLQPLSTSQGFWVFKQLAKITDYADNIRTGRFAVGSAGSLQTFRHIKNGLQAPVSLTIRSVRTLDDLASDISEKMMFSRSELLSRLTSKDDCKKYGFTPETIPAMFIPNTYDFYWDTSVDKFLDKMHKEYNKFWTFERKQKAKTAGLSEVEVITLASIVDEETDNEAEMPKVAGMYINRLHLNMPLQADPTIKFATKNFTAHRIYQKWLTVDSPYNTYKYRGLPPGPIRIPSIAAINAVLNYVHHDYIYMCAKEDFSGTHNFAKTYEEHQVNAAKYAKALNEHGIN